jgi:hypothetical protein
VSRSTLRRIRRITKAAGPVLAELDRRRRNWEDSLRTLAQEHLLRVILVFRYGEPRIDEPLARAYQRALAEINEQEQSCVTGVRRILEQEAPAGDIKSKISTLIRQLPDWLCELCCVDLSIGVLGLEALTISQDIGKLRATKADSDAWPMLPEGMLEPRPDYGEREMSLEEAMSFHTIYKKPKEEWTRHEHRFVEEIRARGRKFSMPDKQD